MSKKYKLAVIIGRFQPLHNGHLVNMIKAAELAESIHILVGSSDQPRTIKNPFSFLERSRMIREAVQSVPTLENAPIRIDPILDYAYNDNQWIKGVQDAVSEWGFVDGDIVVLGHEKDASSWYLRAFPNWHFESLAPYVEHGSTPIDATKIRELFFEGNSGYVVSVVPKNVIDFMDTFSKSESYTTLVQEYKFVVSYKSAWAAAPYPPTFVTVDAVVIQGGHVLLVKRKFSPGMGLWALPGGFLGQDETTRVACIRELREETGIKVPVPVLNGSITHSHLFDNPGRSLRGRTLTQAFLVELNGGDTQLPKVKGSDDASEAKFFSLGAIQNMRHQMFEDHWDIINFMVGRSK